MTVNQQATPVYVMTVLRDNTLEQCRVFAEYNDACKAANDLAFKMWGDSVHFLVQDPPCFLAHECYHVGGIKIYVEIAGVVAASGAAE